MAEAETTTEILTLRVRMTTLGGMVLRRLMTVQGLMAAGWENGRNTGVLPAPASKLAGDPVRCAQNDSDHWIPEWMNNL
jgi:hypothetical protein